MTPPKAAVATSIRIATTGLSMIVSTFAAPITESIACHSHRIGPAQWLSERLAQMRKEPGGATGGETDEQIGLIAHPEDRHAEQEIPQRATADAGKGR